VSSRAPEPIDVGQRATIAHAPFVHFDGGCIGLHIGAIPHWSEARRSLHVRPSSSTHRLLPLV
jgi:hypothetical protein